MAGSSSERAIRDAVAAKLRGLLPDARIIHELVVGGCRADLAAVQPERITLVEIKSERDTLARLPEQLRQFSRAGHVVLIVAHEKWFDRTPYDNGAPRFVPGEELNAGNRRDNADIWAFPEDYGRAMYGRWSLTSWRYENPEPHAFRLLELLWKDELLAECFRHRIAAGTRCNKMTLMRDMAWNMTGKEIARATCRQIRQREFPEADAPIVEKKEVAA